MKSPKANKFQVWVLSAKEDGSYWLDSVSSNPATAQARYNTLRAGYYKAELRTPLGAILYSWDKTRVNTDEESVNFLYAAS